MAIRTNGQVAARVRGIAAEKRKRQADLAACLNLSRMAVSRRFNGTTPFTPEELIYAAEFMGVPVSVFFVESVGAASGEAS